LTIEHNVQNIQTNEFETVSRIALSRFEYESLVDKYSSHRTHNREQSTGTQIVTSYTCKGRVIDGGYHYLEVGVPNRIGPSPTACWDVSHCPWHAPPDTQT